MRPPSREVYRLFSIGLVGNPKGLVVTITFSPIVYEPISIGLVGNPKHAKVEHFRAKDVYEPISIGLVGNVQVFIFTVSSITGVYEPISIGLVGNKSLRTITACPFGLPIVFDRNCDRIFMENLGRSIKIEVTDR